MKVKYKPCSPVFVLPLFSAQATAVTRPNRLVKTSSAKAVQHTILKEDELRRRLGVNPLLDAVQLVQDGEELACLLEQSVGAMAIHKKMAINAYISTSKPRFFADEIFRILKSVLGVVDMHFNQEESRFHGFVNNKIESNGLVQECISLLCGYAYPARWCEDEDLDQVRQVFGIEGAVTLRGIYDYLDCILGILQCDPQNWYETETETETESEGEFTPWK